MEIILWITILAILGMVLVYLVSPFIIALFFFLESIAEWFGKDKSG